MKLIKFSCILGQYNTTIEIRRRRFTLKKKNLISDLYDCLGLLNSTITDHYDTNYDTNLNELLPYLSYGIPSSSFAIGINGQGTNTVYGLALQKAGPIVAFAKKCHYRYPTVAFSIKATIGIFIVAYESFCQDNL